MTPLKDDDEFLQMLIDRAKQRDKKIEKIHSRLDLEQKTMRFVTNPVLIILILAVLITLG